MRKFLLLILVTLLPVVAVLGVIQIARGQGDTILVSQETDGDNLREIRVPEGVYDPEDPAAISDFDTFSPTCYQPDPAQDACYINWYALSANSSPSNMRAISVTIDAVGPVARIQGFFQTSLYVPFNMFGEGFKVPCGALGSGGSPTLGESYHWSAEARDATGAWIGNYGNLFCPAYTP